MSAHKFDLSKRVRNKAYNVDTFLLKRIQTDLLGPGIFLVLTGAVTLSLGVYLYHQTAKSNAYALFGGSILGLLIPLIRPGRPIRVGALFGSEIPKKLNQYETEIETVMLQFRNRLFLIALFVPFFAWLLKLISDYPLEVVELDTMLIIAVFSWVGIGGMASGLQFLLVVWQLANKSRS